MRAKLRAEAGDPRETLVSIQSALRERRYVSEAAARYAHALALLRVSQIRDAQGEVDKLRALRIDSPMIETLDARVKFAAGDKARALSVLTAAQKRYPYSRAISYSQIAALQDSADTVRRLEEQGATPVKQTSAEFGKYMQDEATRWQMVIDKAGIKGE